MMITMILHTVKRRLLLLLSLVIPLPLCAEDKPAGPTAEEKAALELLERKVLYHPRKYGSGTVEKFLAGGGERLTYKTAQGAQSGWFLPPAKPAADGRLWIVCGGNGTLALEMAGFCRREGFPSDGWLLVDYPGYGECAGAPSPAAIRENLKSCVPLAAARMKLEVKALPDSACVLGHSLGCAAALLAVEEFQLRRALLLAPFTSTRDMAAERFALPATVPLQHLFDNRQGLQSLSRAGGKCCIFHGTADEVIPVSMATRLAEEFPAAVQFTPVKNGRHNDLARLAAADIVKAMTALRGAAK
jgi:uncharacterized protein